MVSELANSVARVSADADLCPGDNAGGVRGYMINACRCKSVRVYEDGGVHAFGFRDLLGIAFRAVMRRINQDGDAGVSGRAWLVLYACVRACDYAARFYLYVVRNGFTGTFALPRYSG